MKSSQLDAAMAAAFGVNGDFGKALLAFFGCRVGWRFFARTGDKRIYRLNHKEKYGGGYKQKRNDGVNKMTIRKLTAVYGKQKPAEIRHFGNGGNKRSENIRDESRDDRTKSGTDNNTDSQVNDIPSEQKLFEFF